MALEYTTITVDMTRIDSTTPTGTLYAELSHVVTLANNDVVYPEKRAFTVTNGAASISLACTATAIKSQNAPYVISFAPTGGTERTLGRIIPTASASALNLADLLEVGATSLVTTRTVVAASNIATFASIAALQATSGRGNSDLAFVNGVGWYRCETPSATAASGTRVVVDASSARWVLECESLVTYEKWYDVRQFGATGDGITDDTAAIQAAATAIAADGGGLLVFPGGTYLSTAWTYADTVIPYGLAGAKYKFGSVTVDIPRGSETTGPLEYYVSTTGSATNHGLTATCALDKPSTAVNRLPRNIYHDTMINIAAGSYAESAMLDQYGRACGIVLDYLTLHPKRVAVDATYPAGRSTPSEGQKFAAISIVGAGSASVTIQGPGASAKSGFLSRLRDVWLQGVTIQGYDICLIAHEGGKISGTDVKIRTATTVGVMVESEMAAIEMAALDVSVTGSYCVWVLAGMLSLSGATTITNGTASAPAILVDHGFLQFGTGGTVQSVDATVRTGISGFNSWMSVAGTHDKSPIINTGGFLAISGATLKNATGSGAAAVTNCGGACSIGGTSHVYDNATGVKLQGGWLEIQSTDSVGGGNENTVAGVEVWSGYYRYSPYDVGTLGNAIKGPTGTTEKHVIYRNPAAALFSAENQAENTSAFGGNGLRDGINTLLAKAKSPSDTTRSTALYGAWNGIASITTTTIADIASKLGAMATALATAGLIADATRYQVTGTSETAPWHDRVRYRYNLLVRDLQSFGLMVPGEQAAQPDLLITVLTTPWTIQARDRYVITNLTVAGAVALTLPAAANGLRITIKEGKGDGAANNVTITPAAGTIDGAATKVISSNYGAADLVSDGTNWFTV